MLESEVKKKVKAIIEAHGGWHFSPMSMGYTRAGIPDIICCIRGYFVAIECKVDATSKVHPAQKRELAAIDNAGGRALLIHKDNLEGLEKCLKALIALSDTSTAG